MSPSLLALIFLLHTPADSSEPTELGSEAEAVESIDETNDTGSDEVEENHGEQEYEELVCQERCSHSDVVPPIEPNERNRGCNIHNTGFNGPGLLLLAAGGLLIGRRRR